MQYENFLVAISTFFSVAQLTCVVTHPKITAKHLYSYFTATYFLTLTVMIWFTWKTTYASLGFNLQTFTDAADLVWPFAVFLFAVYMFNTRLATLLSKFL